MQHRGGADDPRRRRSTQALLQAMGQDEIGHVVQGEGALEPFRRDLPRREKAAGIVDQDVDTRLGCCDLRAGPLHIGEQRKIGVMSTMGFMRSDAAQAHEGLFGAFPIARDDYQAGAEAGQPLRCAPPESRGGPGDDDDLAANRRLLGCRYLSCRAKAKMSSDFDIMTKRTVRIVLDEARVLEMPFVEGSIRLHGRAAPFGQVGVPRPGPPGFLRAVPT
jgi:hypothetical protein